MSFLSTKLLQLAKLQYQKGDFLEALATFQEVSEAALSEPHPENWIDSQRLQLQSLNELDRFEEATPIFEKVLEFCQTTTDAKLLGRAQVTLGFYLLQKNIVGQAQGFFTTAATQATRAQDYETLARTLMFETFMNALPDQQKWDQALRCLDKVELLAGCSSELEDIKITCLLFRAYIHAKRRTYEQAGALLWRAYELAQVHGHHLLMPALLLQLGQLHREMGQQTQAQIFFDLSLKGVDSKRHPRQFRRISEEVRPYASPSGVHHDFIVHADSALIQEKDLGFIDFKNQHVLLDMALLMLKNQGQRFTKEDLVETVWKQAYNPGQHDNLIYVSIKRLRALIEPDPENPRYILRDRRGYYFSANCSISFEQPQETHT